MDVRGVLISGYDEWQAFDEMTTPGLAGLLPKPFLLGDLVATLRTVFEGR